MGCVMLRYTGPGASDDCPGNPDNSGGYLAGKFAYPAPRPAFLAPADFVRSDPAPRPTNSLVRKLETFARLGSDEIDALVALSRFPKLVRSEQTLVHEGASIDHVCLVVEGLACRYKLLAGGRRQIMGYLIPGELCDVQFLTCNTADYSVVAVGDAQVVKIPVHKLADLIVRYPKIARALSMSALVDCAILREWLLNIGQRDAVEKLSHFFCEMKVRMNAIGRVDNDGSFELPVNQAALADTIGLTPVHINRTLQRLRTAGLILLSHRRLTILDQESLAAIAGFDAHYLRPRRLVG